MFNWYYEGAAKGASSSRWQIGIVAWGNPKKNKESALSGGTMSSLAHASRHDKLSGEGEIHRIGSLKE
jgi:hypothetical protein